MRIVISGPKASGKTTIARCVADRLGWPLCETDARIEQRYRKRTGREVRFREIWNELGESGFREMEREVVDEIIRENPAVVGTGGSTLFDPTVRELLCRDAFVVLVHAPAEVLWERVKGGGLPAYLKDEPDPFRAFAGRVAHAEDLVRPMARLVIDTGELSRDEAVNRIVDAASNPSS
ncbi:MAG: shikimate kinase [Verrucomicrobiota bacterium]